MDVIYERTIRNISSRKFSFNPLKNPRILETIWPSTAFLISQRNKNAKKNFKHRYSVYVQLLKLKLQNESMMRRDFNRHYLFCNLCKEVECRSFCIVFAFHALVSIFCMLSSHNNNWLEVEVEKKRGKACGMENWSQ